MNNKDFEAAKKEAAQSVNDFQEKISEKMENSGDPEQIVLILVNAYIEVDTKITIVEKELETLEDELIGLSDKMTKEDPNVKSASTLDSGTTDDPSETMEEQYNRALENYNLLKKEFGALSDQREAILGQVPAHAEDFFNQMVITIEDREAEGKAELN